MSMPNWYDQPGAPAMAFPVTLGDVVACGTCFAVVMRRDYDQHMDWHFPRDED